MLSPVDDLPRDNECNFPSSRNEFVLAKRVSDDVFDLKPVYNKKSP